MNRFMALAFELAKKSDPFPNPKVGAVLVRDDKVIGIGYHKAPGKLHAEIEAIDDAISKHSAETVRGTILYVTLEPCSHDIKRTLPCTKKIIECRIARVVFAMEDPNPLVSGNGARALRDVGVEVVGPTDQRYGEKMNRKYIAHIKKRPFVAIKMAMSTDGKTATRTGNSKWISCEESREFVHHLRSKFDAVMVGTGTIKTDNPKLTTHGKGNDPYRVIVDGELTTPTNANVIKNKDGKTIIVTSEKAKNNKIKNKKIAQLERNGVRVLFCGSKTVDLERLVIALSAMSMKKILIEGGSELNASALDAGIVNKLYFFIAPKIIGGRNAKPVIGGEGIEKMNEALVLKNMKIKRIGTDFLLEADVQLKGSALPLLSWK